MSSKFDLECINKDWEAAVESIEKLDVMRKEDMNKLNELYKKDIEYPPELHETTMHEISELQIVLNGHLELTTYAYNMYNRVYALAYDRGYTLGADNKWHDTFKAFTNKWRTVQERLKYLNERKDEIEKEIQAEWNQQNDIHKEGLENGYKLDTKTMNWSEQ